MASVPAAAKRTAAIVRRFGDASEASAERTIATLFGGRPRGDEELEDRYRQIGRDVADLVATVKGGDVYIHVACSKFADRGGHVVKRSDD